MTSIEWTDATWNPVTGCDRVSPGCAHCYALDLAARLKAMGQARYQRDGDPRTSGPGFGVTLHPDKLEEPLRWRKPRMVFVNSMSDLFHEEIPDDYIRSVFQVMEQAQRHTFQVLTKRPERMRAFLADWLGGYAAQFDRLPADHSNGWHGATSTSPAADHARGRAAHGIPNVWLGVSIENRRFVDRADLLYETPAAVRFISAEPLLGPLLKNVSGVSSETGHYSRWKDGYEGEELNLTGIDWVIVGGESGPVHRPIEANWIRDLRDRCRDEHIAFFFKQWGGRTPKAGGRELDGRTWDEYPAREAVSA